MPTVPSETPDQVNPAVEEEQPQPQPQKQWQSAMDRDKEPPKKDAYRFPSFNIPERRREELALKSLPSAAAAKLLADRERTIQGMKLATEAGIPVDLAINNYDKFEPLIKAPVYDPAKLKDSPELRRIYEEDPNWISVFGPEEAKLKTLSETFWRVGDTRRPRSQQERQRWAIRKAEREYPNEPLPQTKQTSNDPELEKILGPMPTETLYSKVGASETEADILAPYVASEGESDEQWRLGWGIKNRRQKAYLKHLEYAKYTDAFISSNEEIGAFEEVSRRYRENSTFLVPVAATMVDLTEATRLYFLAANYESTGEISRDDEDELILAYKLEEAMNSRGYSFMGQVASVVEEAPAFMGEVLMTLGAGGVAKAGAKKLASEAVAEVVRRAGLKILEKRAKPGILRKIGSSAFGGVVQAGVQTALTPHRVALGTIRNMTPDGGLETEDGQVHYKVKADSGKSFWLSFSQATYSQFTELFSENFGGPLDRVVSPIGKKLYGSWLTHNPGGTERMFLKAFKKAGIHSVTSEIAEEELAKLMDALGGHVALSDNTKYGLPLVSEHGTTLEELAVMAVSFGGMQYGARGAGYAADKILGISDSELEAAKESEGMMKSIGQAVNDLDMSKDFPEGVAKYTAEATENTGGDKVAINARKLHQYFSGLKTDDGMPVNPEEMVVSLLGESALPAYRDAIENTDGDIEIPLSVYNSKIANHPQHSAFFEQATRRNVHYSTVEEAERNNAEVKEMLAQESATEAEIAQKKKDKKQKQAAIPLTPREALAERNLKAARVLAESQRKQVKGTAAEAEGKPAGTILSLLLASVANDAGVELSEVAEKFAPTITLPETVTDNPNALSQGAQTDTPEFKEWFGESKVAGEDGKPKVVWHGSPRRFTAFDPAEKGSRTDSGWLGSGFYFGGRQHAALYGSVDRHGLDFATDPRNTNPRLGYYPTGMHSALYPVHLSLQNPLVLTARPDRGGPYSNHGDPGVISKDQDQSRELQIREELGLPRGVTPQQVTDAAKAQGYDGVIFYQNDETDTDPEFGPEYVVFDPTQIKSATSNRGTFDPKDPNILHQSEKLDPIEVLGSDLYKSLMNQGGFSYGMLASGPPTTGFMVSDRKEIEERFDPGTITEEDLVQYMIKNDQALSEPGRYFGGWKDKEGVVFLDVSRNVESKEEAIALAVAHNQDAIYDVVNNRDIVTKKEERDGRSETPVPSEAETGDRSGEARGADSADSEITIRAAGSAGSSANLDTGGGSGGDSAGRAASANALQFPRLAGLPKGSEGPSQRLHAAKKRYLKKKGRANRRAAAFVRVNSYSGKRRAQAYADMRHQPRNKQVKAAYAALIAETVEQYQLIKELGIKVSIIPDGQSSPYQNSQDLRNDIANNHIWVYPTSSGFGGSNSKEDLAKIKDNPLLAPTDERVGDHIMLANDLFRVVHDVFGHAMEGVEFGPHGEENAWNAHVRMYSPLAAMAMTSETRGQNSWVNYGPEAEHNRANRAQTKYAEQKIGLLPDWAIYDELAPDVSETDTAIDSVVSIKSALEIAGDRKWESVASLQRAMLERMFAAVRAATGLEIDDTGMPTDKTPGKDRDLIAYLVRVAVKDGKHAIDNNPNAIGWYGEKVEQMLELMSLRYPEIKTDREARLAMLAVVAITSNGETVENNFNLAAKSYATYRRTGKLGNKIVAVRKGDMIAAVNLFNKLLAKYGAERLEKFILTDYTVGEIKAMGFKVSGELVDQNVRGSIVFGPKVGNGFLSNLHGYFAALTMDVWEMRTWKRWTGSLGIGTPHLVGEKTKDFEDVIEELKQDPAELARLSEIAKVDLASDAISLDEKATLVRKAAVKEERRLAMVSTPIGERLRLTGNRLWVVTYEEHKQPGTGTARRLHREVFRGALAILQEQYPALTMADLQAAFWYMEKKLYRNAKVDSKASAEESAMTNTVDYATAATAHVKEKGVSQKRIDAALKGLEDERVRLRSGVRVDGEGRAPRGDNAAGNDSGAAGQLREIQGRASIGSGFTDQEKADFAEAVVNPASGTQGKTLYQGKSIDSSASGTQGKTLYQGKWYHSKLEDAISKPGALPEVFTKAEFDGVTKQVKKSEKFWRGIDEFYALNQSPDGKYKKKDLQRFLSLNSIEIEELELGMTDPDWQNKFAPLYQQRLGQLIEAALDREEQAHQENEIEQFERQRRRSLISIREDITDIVDDMARLEDGEVAARDMLQGRLNAARGFLEETEDEEFEPSEFDREAAADSMSQATDFIQAATEWAEREVGVSQKVQQFAEHIRDRPSGGKYFEFILKFAELNTAKPFEIFKGGHHDIERGAVVHVLASTYDIDGESILYIHEIQSDWAQGARKTRTGEFFKGEPVTNLDVDKYLEKFGGEIRNFGTEEDPEWKYALHGEWHGGLVNKDHGFNERDEAERVRRVDVGRAIQEKADLVPRAPFIEKTEQWTALMMKRMITLAAERGIDRVVFSTGQQVHDRWDVLKRAREIIWKPETHTITAYNGEGRLIVTLPGIRGVDLAEAVGSEVADQLMTTKSNPSGAIVVSNVKVKSSGKAFKKYYDEMLVSVVNDLVKKFGVKVAPFVVLDDSGRRSASVNRLGPNGQNPEQFEVKVMGRTAATLDTSEQADAFVTAFSGMPPTESTKEETITTLGEIESGAFRGTLLGYANRSDTKVWWERLDHGERSKPTGPIRQTRESIDGSDFDHAKELDPSFTDATRFKVTIQISGSGQLTHGIEMNEKLVDSAVTRGWEMFQGEEAHGPLAQVVFGRGVPLIELFKGANSSSLIHEHAHIYLETLMHFSSMPGASQEIKDKMEALLKWFGLKDVSEIQREHHERFAEAFMTYMYEGRAPSKALRKLFAQMRQMLFGLYLSARALFGAELDPEIRRIFDRMLATDKEIQEVKEEEGYGTLITDFSDTNEEFREEYEAKAKEMDEEVRERIRAKALEDLRREETEAHRKEKEAKKQRILKELKETPLYRAIDYLRGGGAPLNDLPESDLAELATKKGFEGDEEALDELDGGGIPRYKFDVQEVKEIYADHHGESIQWVKTARFAKDLRFATGSNTAPVAMIASWFGFDSPIDFLTQLAEAPKAESVAEEQAEAEMQAQGDRITEAEIQELATNYYHNSSASELRLMELEYLEERNAKQLGKAITDPQLLRNTPLLDVIKEQSKQAIESMPIKTINPEVYKASERRSARKAEVSLRQGKLEQAIDSSRRRLVNGERYRAAQDALETVARFVRKIATLSRSDKKIGKSRDSAYANAARAVLAAHGIEKFDQTPESYLSQIKELEPDTYDAFISMVQSATEGADREAGLGGLTYGKFLEVKQTVEALLEKSVSSKQTEIEGKQRETAELRSELTSRLAPHGKNSIPADKRSTWQKAKVRLMGLASSMQIVLNWADGWDFGDPMGPFKRYISRKVSTASDHYKVKRAEAYKKIKEILGRHAGEYGRRDIVAERIGVDGRSYTFTGLSALLHAILHTGNESNKRRLLLAGQNESGPWGFEREDGTIDDTNWRNFLTKMARDGVLTEEHFKTVQMIWDLLESLKPDAQKAHRKIYGHYFKPITRDPTWTPFGMIEGGYVPAKVDPSQVAEQGIRDAKAEIEDNDNFSIFPQPGFAKGRVKKYAKPLQLDVTHLMGHIDQVLRFSHVAQHTLEVGRLILHPDFVNEMQRVDETAVSELLVPWLKRASTQRGKQLEGEAGRAITKGANWLMRTSGMHIMAGNIGNMLQQLTGILPAAIKVKPKYLLGAMLDLTSTGGKAAEAVVARSEFMRVTMGAHAADLMGDINKILLDPGLIKRGREFIEENGLVMQKLTQNLVNYITWMGAYDQAIDQNISEPDAVHIADEAVRFTQGSSAVEDRSVLTTQDSYVRLALMFHTYFNMILNLLASEYKIAERTVGLVRGAPRLLFVFMMGVYIVAIISELLMSMVAGGPDPDEDEASSYSDFWMDVLVRGPVKGIVAMVPGSSAARPVISYAIGTKKDRAMNRDIRVSPVLAMLEGASAAPFDLVKHLTDPNDGQKSGRVTEQTVTAIGTYLGLPTQFIGKSLGYAVGVSEGEIKPSGEIDYVRGVLTGKK